MESGGRKIGENKLLSKKKRFVNAATLLHCFGVSAAEDECWATAACVCSPCCVLHAVLDKVWPTAHRRDGAVIACACISKARLVHNGTAGRMPISWLTLAVY